MSHLILIYTVCKFSYFRLWYLKELNKSVQQINFWLIPSYTAHEKTFSNCAILSVCFFPRRIIAFLLCIISADNLLSLN